MESATATDIITHPQQTDARREGFTTLIGGADGTSLAPLMDGSLEHARKWTVSHGVNVNWQTIKEFQKSLSTLPLGVNFGMFAGYNGIRRAVIHENGGDPTDKELDVIMHIVETALHEGAIGIALNLDTAHGRRISHEEARRAAKACADAKKPLALRLRAQADHFMEAASEALTLYRTTGARMIITDFLPRTMNKAEEKDFHLAYEMLAGRGDGLYIELRCDTGRLIPIYELLPRFAQVGSLETMNALIRDGGMRKKLIAGLPRLEGAHIAHAPREYAALYGITLEAFAHNRELNGKEALLELMRMTKLRATICIPNELSPLHTELIKNERMLVSGDPQSVFKVVDDARLPLETAILKLSGLPASTLGLAKRGIIAENYAADLVLMNDKNEVMRTIVNGNLNENGGICANL
jgi:N-acyl-D-aspartate/D-glutamate deacylase